MRSVAERRMRQRILVVDDDAGIRESFVLAFQNHCEVLTAPSAVEAMTILNGHALDLVVLDYCLPDGPGSDVLQRIKRDWPSLPVIVITAYGSETLCAQLFRLGAREYFSKPYSLDAVVGAVKDLLAVPKAGTRRDALRARPVAECVQASRPFHPGIQRALLWIEAHYADPISLPQIAREAAMSPFHFCRTFKTVVGRGFHHHLTRLRVEKAKEMFRESQRDVIEVAFVVGFSNLSCFYTAFRRVTGQSPCAWRRSARPAVSRNFS